MKRAMAKQAEAERERRAKIIAAEGETPGKREKLAQAATVMAAPRHRSNCDISKPFPR